MNVNTNAELSENDLDIENLLSYLSQVVLCKTEERTRDEHRKMERYKETISSLKSEVNQRKNEVSKLASELSKEKALSRVLSILETLKREGLWTGKNGEKLSEILISLPNRSFVQLSELAERLSIILP